eukprot:1976937-Pleurochrysis_carterae.AAC.6
MRWAEDGAVLSKLAMAAAKRGAAPRHLIMMEVGSLARATEHVHTDRQHASHVWALAASHRRGQGISQFPALPAVIP